jgi:hypothetical protein
MVAQKASGILVVALVQSYVVELLWNHHVISCSMYYSLSFDITFYFVLLHFFYVMDGPSKLF